jgi:CRP-like cAMP-binding protein
MALQSNRSHLVKSSRNILLRRLSPSDQALLEPHVEERLVSCGAPLIRQDDELDSVHFPDSAIFSLVERVGPDKFAEIAVVGREGMLGWPAILGCNNSTHAATCQIQGSVIRISAAPLLAACARSPSLWPALLQFVHLIIVQMARAIASHLQDPLDQRLARWLLMRHDRVGGDILLVHHDEIADRLNVRRASVTDGLHILEGDCMIRCNRGRIAIRDRAALETFAGDSYGVVEAHYRTLIAPFGKSLRQVA